MYGHSGYHNPYDPFPFFYMMNRFNRDDRNDEDELKMFRKYKDLFQEMKKEFEPPKDGGKKNEEKWTTNDYFTFIVCFVSVVGLGGAWMIIHELVKLAEVIHR